MLKKKGRSTFQRKPAGDHTQTNPTFDDLARATKWTTSWPPTSARCWRRWPNSERRGAAASERPAGNATFSCTTSCVNGSNTDWLVVVLKLLLLLCDSVLPTFSLPLFFMYWPCLKTHILPLNSFPPQQWQFISVLESQSTLFNVVCSLRNSGFGKKNKTKTKHFCFN